MTSMSKPINVMVDSTTKDAATNILNDLGLSMSTAINMFLRQVVKNEGIPFEVKNPKPSRELVKSLKEAKRIEEGKIKVQSYDNREDLKESLLSDN